MSSEGHRSRLRERFTKNRLDGFQDYEVLEFLLSFIFTRIDVKPLAKELLKQFGSFSKVLDANIEELQKVKGMGKTSAISLVAFREIMSFYFKDKPKVDRLQISTMSGLVEMLRASIGHRENEVLFAIFLNSKNEVISTKELGEGTPTMASAFPRKIIQEAILLKATSIILSHNHPDGIAEPSDSDLSVTEEIRKALSFIDIELQDHIILAGEEYYSFKREVFITH
jgi:DNA repair protein RadC